MELVENRSTESEGEISIFEIIGHRERPFYNLYEEDEPVTDQKVLKSKIYQYLTVRESDAK